MNHPTVQFWITMFSTYGWVLLLLLMERIWYFQKQPLLRPGFIWDVIYTYQNIVLQIIFLASAPIIVERILAKMFAESYFPLEGAFLQGALEDRSILLNFTVLIILGETVFYVAHYLAHRVSFLWEFHRVHHSSLIVDSFSTSRFHIFDRILFTLPTLLLMIYLKARPEAIVFYFFFRAFMDRYIHSNIPGPRWPHKLMFSSPIFHRWHHSTTPPLLHKYNFSGNFIFMDVLFGTAYDPDPKTHPLPAKFGEEYSNNLFVQQVLPFVFLYKRFKKRWLQNHPPQPQNT